MIQRAFATIDLASALGMMGVAPPSASISIDGAFVTAATLDAAAISALPKATVYGGLHVGRTGIDGRGPSAGLCGQSQPHCHLQCARPLPAPGAVRRYAGAMRE